MEFYSQDTQDTCQRMSRHKPACGAAGISIERHLFLLGVVLDKIPVTPHNAHEDKHKKTRPHAWDPVLWRTPINLSREGIRFKKPKKRPRASKRDVGFY